MFLLPIFHQKKKRYAEITQITPFHADLGCDSIQGNVCINISIIMCIFVYLVPVGTPEVVAENTSSVSPACRKRRRCIALVADTA